VEPRSVRDNSKILLNGPWFHFPRQEVPTMEYLVTMTTHVPEGTPLLPHPNDPASQS
jgi:hypothetical protein